MDPDATIERLSAIEIRELAALADGSLPPRRRAAVQARVDASPELQALVAEQRRALAAVHSAAGPAPPALRARVTAQRRAAAPAARRRRVVLVGGAAAALAAVIAALVLVLPGGSPGRPSIVQAAALSVRSAITR